MAKKKEEKREEKHTNRTVSRWSFVDLLAFCGLAASALLLLVGPILGWILKNTGGAVVLQALNMIAQYCLLAAIAIPAWYFVRGKRKGWKVFYFIVLAIYIAGAVLGVALKI